MRYSNNSCSKSCFLFSAFCFWISGFALLVFGFWLLLDPKRSYVLSLVDFSEDDPLLKFGVYGLLAIELFTFFVGFVGCCGALKAERCLLSSCIFFLLITFVGKWTVASMAFAYKEKFPGNQMTTYLANISQNRYSRDRWVLPIMDSVQFYQQCCGGEGPMNYFNSFWYLTNTERGTRSFVPRSCCRQSQNGRAWALESIDPMCTTYQYYTKAFNDSVNFKGCGEPMKKWLYDNVSLFVLVVLASSIIDLILVCSGTVYIRQILGYSFVDN